MKVILIMAMTVDGMIARHSSHFPDWTCSADKRMFKKISQQAGVVIMGRRTFDTIGKPLPGRLNVVMTRHPEQFDTMENLVFSNESPEKLLAGLAARGYQEVALTGGAYINTLFIRAGCIDEFILTLSPKMFGQGISLFSETIDLDLKLLDVHRLEEQTLVLRYKVIDGKSGNT